MTWSEFLTHILKAQAQTLHRLAAFFGEAEFLEILETAGEESPPPPLFKIKKEWMASPSPASEKEAPQAYLELEGAVHEMHLSAFLEFHLWAYPFYRIFIESPIQLKTKIVESGNSEVLQTLVEEAIIQAQAWIRSLPIRAELATQTQSIARVPWIRFRTVVLEKMGKRPVSGLKVLENKKRE